MWWWKINFGVFIPGLALNYLLQNNFKENVGMRPNSRKIGVLITDGKSQDDVIVNSQNLRDQDIELYAIGKQRSIQFASTKSLYKVKLSNTVNQSAHDFLIAL